MARTSLIPGRVKNTGIDLLIAGVLFGGALIGLSYVNQRFGILSRFEGGVGSLGTTLGKSVGIGLTNVSSGLAQGFLGKSEPSTGGTGQFGTNPSTAQQNLRDNLTIGGLLDPNSPNFIGGAFSPPNAYGDTGQGTSTQTQGGFAELITAIEKNPVEDTTRNLTSGTTFKVFTDIFKDIQAAPAGGATPKTPLNVAEIIKQAGQRISQQSTLAQNKKIVNSSGIQTTKNPFGGFASANAQETTLQALIAANAKRYPQYFKVV